MIFYHRTGFSYIITSMFERYHGGNIYQASQESGIPIDRILDFSASLSPLPLPERAKELLVRADSLVKAYPEPWAESLKKALAEDYEIEERFLLCGSGSISLLYALASVLKVSDIGIIVPTFTEYERAFAAFNSDIKFVYIKAESNKDFKVDLSTIIEVLDKVQCIVICNPNNPTGVVLPPLWIKEILDKASSKDRWVIIDEAFIDYVPEYSVMHFVREYSNLIVLRSLTKFYGIASLRVGFVVAQSKILHEIKKVVPPWSVTQLSIEISKVLLSDKQFKSRVFQWLKQEKSFMEQGLRRLNIRYFPSLVNFYLIQTPKASALWQRLLQKGILLRRCTDFKGLDYRFLRISLRTREDNKILLQELQNYLA